MPAIAARFTRPSTAASPLTLRPNTQAITAHTNTTAITATVASVNEAVSYTGTLSKAQVPMYMRDGRAFPATAFQWSKAMMSSPAVSR